MSQPSSAPPTNSPDLDSSLNGREDAIMEELYAYRDEHAARHNYNLWSIYEELKAHEAENDFMIRADLRPVEPRELDEDEGE